MFVVASRLLRSDDTVVVGSGRAFVVAMLAQRLHAPSISLLIDSGSIGPYFASIPRSVSDARMAHRAVRHGSTLEVLGPLLSRPGVVALLGAAQVDRFGRVNASYVRTADGRRRRLVGSGGAAAMMARAHRTIVVTRHERARLPERCDYVSSVSGFRPGEGSRRPDLTVVTDLCVFQPFETGDLGVVALMPSVRLDRIESNTGFSPRVAERLEQLAPPTALELRVLRTIVDPEGIYLKAGTPN